MSKTALIIQARSNSKRLRKKVLQEINGITMLDMCMERTRKSKEVDEFILATTTAKEDDQLEVIAKQHGFKVVRGSEEDVLGRFESAVRLYWPDYIVRVTADCPLIDASLIDQCVRLVKSGNYDYVNNCGTFPDGLDVEVFTRSVLLKAAVECESKDSREHVTTWIRENKNSRIGELRYECDLSALRWTVDEPEDLEVIREIIKKLKGNKHFSWTEVLRLTNTCPEIFEMNRKHQRNEGSKMGTGQKLWRRAKRVIPGGNMLLSKRAEMFLPDKWPTYFKKAKGCHVWDLDDNKYIDMSIMGIGTNILGYGNDDVDMK